MMRTLDQLFVHELQDVWAAEQQVATALDRMTLETSSPQLRHALQTHRTETQTHIDRLERIFDQLRIQPRQVSCEGMDGIVSEFDSFKLENQPAPAVHEVFALGASKRVEHYEIAVYEELVRMANALGYAHVASQLQATLAEEREQLGRIERAARTTNLQGLAAANRRYGESIGRERHEPVPAQGSVGR